LPGERDNARNNARCTKARKATHGLDGGRHQDVIDIKTGTGLSVEESIRMTEINGESTSMVWPTLGSKTENRKTVRRCAIISGDVSMQLA